ncbi:MAG: GGDEF domain-containing protein, partial [Gammaproteobacteria bacterium]|nr:GGDEF domain-containing protein [Gammaproteobacteria bacterium]
MSPLVPASSRRPIYRLSTDFPLAILTLLGGVAAFGIFPFAIYRFATGSIFHGVVDLLIVACIAAAVIYAWRTGRVGFAGRFVAITSSIGCMAIALVLGLPGLLWMYVALHANYLLLPPRYALGASALALALLAVQGRAFETPLLMVMFLVTASIISLFAYIFSSRMQAQRLQLEMLAGSDPLTGAYNRRAMETELEVAVELQRRERRVYGLAVIDLDHFKR